MDIMQLAQAFAAAGENPDPWAQILGATGMPPPPPGADLVQYFMQGPRPGVDPNEVWGGVPLAGGAAPPPFAEGIGMGGLSMPGAPQVPPHMQLPPGIGPPEAPPPAGGTLGPSDIMASMLPPPGGLPRPPPIAPPVGPPQTALQPRSPIAPQVKAPTTPAPIMSGGIAGAQKAPDATVSGAALNSPSKMLLAALLGGGQMDPLRVPAIGALLRGGKY